MEKKPAIAEFECVNGTGPGEIAIALRDIIAIKAECFNRTIILYGGHIEVVRGSYEDVLKFLQAAGWGDQ